MPPGAKTTCVTMHKCKFESAGSQWPLTNILLMTHIGSDTSSVEVIYSLHGGLASQTPVSSAGVMALSQIHVATQL